MGSSARSFPQRGNLLRILLRSSLLSVEKPCPLSRPRTSSPTPFAFIIKRTVAHEKRLGKAKPESHSAATNPEGLNQVLGDNRILSRGTLLLGRHNLGLGTSYEILPILTGMFNVLVNLTDPSAILNPVLEYSVADNAVATAGCTIPLGEAPTFIVPSGGVGVPNVRLNSQYGTYPFSFFLEVRFYI